MPRLSKRERLRRERISRSLRAYYREQRRLQRVRAEAARRYWRRVKQAAGRHKLTLPQAKRAIRIANQQAIPVRTAAGRIKRIPKAIAAPPVPPPPRPPPVIPPAPPLPEAPPRERPPLPPLGPGEWRSPVAWEHEIAWNLRRVVDKGFVPDPLEFVTEEGTLEGEFDVYVDGEYQRTQRVEFESSADPDTFWFNLHAAAREVHEATMDEEVDYDQISITAMAIRMA